MAENTGHTHYLTNQFLNNEDLNLPNHEDSINESFPDNAYTTASSVFNESLKMLINKTQANMSNYVPYSERVDTYMVPIVFALIFIVGVIGNGTLVIVFVRHRAMRNVPNTYILSLALADLLVIITSVPITTLAYAMESWPWGDPLCWATETAKDVSIGVSVFTLTALSADRYFAIVDPLRKMTAGGGSKRATRFTVAMAVGIWLLAAAFAVPSALNTHVQMFAVSSEKEVPICYPYVSQDNAKLMVLLRFLVYYGIPLVVIGTFYALMARHLVLSAKNAPGEAQGTQRQMRARKKVAVTVLTFVMLFAICFLPHHIYKFWFYYNPTAEEDYDTFWHTFRIIGFCLSFANCCVDPVALYCVSGAFRKHFNRYLLCRYNRMRGREGTNLSLSNSRHLYSSASTRRTNVAMSIRRSTIAREGTVTLLSKDGAKASAKECELNGSGSCGGGSACGGADAGGGARTSTT